SLSPPPSSPLFPASSRSSPAPPSSQENPPAPSLSSPPFSPSTTSPSAPPSASTPSSSSSPELLFSSASRATPASVEPRSLCKTSHIFPNVIQSRHLHFRRRPSHVHAQRPESWRFDLRPRLQADFRRAARPSQCRLGVLSIAAPPRPRPILLPQKFSRRLDHGSFPHFSVRHHLADPHACQRPCHCTDLGRTPAIRGFPLRLRFPRRLLHRPRNDRRHRSLHRGEPARRRHPQSPHARFRLF